MIRLFDALSFRYEHCDLIVITDEEWKDKEGFLLQDIPFAEFVDWYEDYRQMDFLQPTDYVLFNLSTTELFLIHHEGKAVKLVI